MVMALARVGVTQGMAQVAVSGGNGGMQSSCDCSCTSVGSVGRRTARSRVGRSVETVWRARAVGARARAAEAMAVAEAAMGEAAMAAVAQAELMAVAVGTEGSVLGKRAASLVAAGRVVGVRVRGPPAG